MSRQNFHKTYLRCDPEKLYYMDMVKSAILSILEKHPGLSGAQIRRKLMERGIQIGRDRFYRLVDDYKLTLNSKKKAWRRRKYRLLRR
jgi:hypothetical protein